MQKFIYSLLYSAGTLTILALCAALASHISSLIQASMPVYLIAVFLLVALGYRQYSHWGLTLSQYFNATRLNLWARRVFAGVAVIFGLMAALVVILMLRADSYTAEQISTAIYPFLLLVAISLAVFANGKIRKP